MALTALPACLLSQARGGGEGGRLSNNFHIYPKISKSLKSTTGHIIPQVSAELKIIRPRSI